MGEASAQLEKAYAILRISACKEASHTSVGAMAAGRDEIIYSAVRARWTARWRRGFRDEARACRAGFLGAAALREGCHVHAYGGGECIAEACCGARASDHGAEAVVTGAVTLLKGGVIRDRVYRRNRSVGVCGGVDRSQGASGTEKAEEEGSAKRLGPHGERLTILAGEV